MYSNWKLVDTAIVYEDGYAQCIQVQKITITERCINKHIRYVGEYQLKLETVILLNTCRWNNKVVIIRVEREARINRSLRLGPSSISVRFRAEISAKHNINVLLMYFPSPSFSKLIDLESQTGAWYIITKKGAVY